MATRSNFVPLQDFEGLKQGFIISTWVCRQNKEKMPLFYLIYYNLSQSSDSVFPPSWRCNTLLHRVRWSIVSIATTGLHHVQRKQSSIHRHACTHTCQVSCVLVGEGQWWRIIHWPPKSQHHVLLSVAGVLARASYAMCSHTLICLVSHGNKYFESFTPSNFLLLFAHFLPIIYYHR